MAYRPLKESTIRDIRANNPSVKNGSSQADTVHPEPVLVTLNMRMEYDTTNPVQHISEFVAFSKLVVSRYEENLRLVSVYDKETQDVLHYIELHQNMNAADGNAMYKKLREIRRNRRQCKNEIDLLDPVYQFFKSQAGDMVSQLTSVQGRCKQLKTVIDGRQYTLRTGVIQ